jgi:predicted permease
MAHVLADLRYAVRTLRRVPLFTTIAVLSMAFGIAANTAVFTLVDQVVLRKLPVWRPGELVQVSARGTESYGGGIGDGTELSYAMYRDLRDHNRVFADMFCRFPAALHVTHGGRSEQVTGELVSGTFFPVLGIRPALGRLFTRNDEGAAGAHPVAVLAYDYWKSRFNGNPAIIGRSLTVNGHPLEIVGVVHAGFPGLDIGQPVQLYVSISMQPQMGPAWLKLDGRRFRWVQVYGRLRDGSTPDRAQAGLQPLYASLLAQEAKDTAFAAASADTRRQFLAGRLSVSDASRGHSGLRDSVTEPLLILMAVAVGVLLIVCANVANLLIARGAVRQRELALRVAVGAGRRQIIRLLLIESLLLATVGAALGIVLATWGASVLLGYFTTPEAPLAVTPHPDARILLFTSGLALATALIAGIMPAFRSSRVDVAPALKGAGGSVGGEQPRLRKTLVVAQVALSFTLLIGAGLFVRSLNNLLDVNPGFRTTRMLTFSFDLSRAGYVNARSHAFAEQFLDAISHTPGVSSAAYAFQSLLTGGGWGMGFTIEGYQPKSNEDGASMCNAVSPRFFKTLGIPLLAGREFTERDALVGPAPDGWPYRVAVVNETFAKRYFKGGNPLGRHVGIGQDPGTPTPIEIVGVVKDSKHVTIRQEPVPQIFFPYLQSGQLENVTAYVRTEQDPDSLMPALRRRIASLDPQLAVYDVATLEERVERSVVNERLIASLSATLSVMATVLSIVGLYGVMAYMVTRRTREIGIRMALGALSSQIARGVLREAGVLVAIGLGLGFGAAWWLGRYVQSQLYGVSPADTTTIAAAAVMLASVACLASALPARRAARVTPMSALRDE